MEVSCNLDHRFANLRSTACRSAILRTVSSLSAPSVLLESLIAEMLKLQRARRSVDAEAVLTEYIEHFLDVNF